MSVTNGALHAGLVNAAYLAGSSLWIGFVIADEMLKLYDAEHSHVLFFMAQLVSFIALYVLPL